MADLTTLPPVEVFTVAQSILLWCAAVASVPVGIGVALGAYVD